MVTTDHTPPKAGRPRTMSDQEVFQAVYRVLTRRGGLTLAAVAEELGCSAPALLKRFGSKRELLLAFTKISVQSSREQFRKSRLAHTSPMKALEACLLLPEAPGTDELVDAAGVANTLRFYFEVSIDPEFRAISQQWIQEYEEATIGLLAEAVAAGELDEQTDIARLGRTLHAALAGVGVLWVSDSRRSSQERLREVFETCLVPYLRSPFSSSSKIPNG